MGDVFSIYVPSFFIFLGMSIVSPVLAIHAKSFDVSFVVASLGISIYALARFIVDVPVGVMAGRFGRKPLKVAGTLLLAVTST